ncbi:ATP-binding cassette domain-containing protein [Neobacillus notoginsengisoli]|uniref:ATP-binding cassette domain-containing protein n=1 Tax=Neobacillus notoginsengisoli TaxID=1578198 RepID=A0A417YPI7_9BACI|nr:AAA family ATPase [Neobacillus notoginsengisoli]RHW35742.1 ATP-binding cassette domain-containing protein [Neobacillus notoginsengisoli]
MKLERHTQFIREIILKKEMVESDDRFPFQLPVIRNFQDLVLHPSVTYIVGENGMGKSTLLEGIAVAYGFNPEGGTLNFNFSSYDSHSDLHEYLRLVKGVFMPTDNFFFRSETFYNLATNIEEMDRVGGGGRIIDSFGGKSLHEQSHGESFFAAFNERFQGNGLYILDEPEAALSPLRQMSLLARIDQLVRTGSQFIISTHSPVIMAYPDAKILEITEEGINETSLENTSHYTLMNQFFNDRERFLRHLLE